MHKYITSLLLTLALLIPQIAVAIDIIAHRGASGYLPEHTKEAAVLAYMQGAHYIEQDLVLSKDNHLVVLHDIHIETVTNVEQVYPDRARSDGRFYAIDFSLSELRHLRVHERQKRNGEVVFPSRYRGNAHFTIATFAEQVELIRALNESFGKQTGFYTEIKTPEWHLEQGKDIALSLANELKRLSLNQPHSRIFVQSFEPNSLKRLHADLGVNVPLIQLIAENGWQESSADYTAMQSAEGLVRISQYAQGIGPWLPQVVNNNQMTAFYKRAKSAGLLVHPYTFREDVINDNTKAQALFNLLVQNEVDGLFTDQVKPYMLVE
ncbi:MAG: glycerophosphodiester phosphodiesterase [Glaciecola sp.]